MLDKVEFDTIYHEHLCYYSLTALHLLFRQHALRIEDVKRLSIHGGTLRLFVGHEAATRQGQAVSDLLRKRLPGEWTVRNTIWTSQSGLRP